MRFLLLYWKWIAAAAVVAGLVIFYNVHVDGVVREAVAKATIERDAQWRTSEQNAVNAAKVAAKKKEDAQAAQFVSLQLEYNEEKANAEKVAAAKLAAVHAGYRLRISAGCTSAADVPGAPAPAAGSDGPPRAQFLGEADSAFFVGEAKRANEIVRQLSLCQRTLISERSAP